MLDIRALRYFEAVARLRSVSAAAKECYVTQPAISKQIASLESQLAVQLFHRSPTGMVLTTAGETLQRYGADLLSRSQQLEDLLTSMFRGRPAFQVACQPTTAHYVVAPFIAETDAPIVDLRTAHARDVDRMLDEDCDMAVSSHVPPEHRETLKISHIPISVQLTTRLAADLRLEGGADLGALRELRLLLPGHGSGVELAVRAACETSGVPLDEARACSSGTIAQAVAANEHGIAIVTEPAQFGLVAFPAVVDGQPLTISHYASWSRSHYARSDIAQLAAGLHRWMRDRQPWHQD